MPPTTPLGLLSRSHTALRGAGAGTLCTPQRRARLATRKQGADSRRDQRFTPVPPSTAHRQGDECTGLFSVLSADDLTLTSL